MHVRKLTKPRPASGGDVTFILDTLAQLLSVIQAIQAVLEKD
ncbi:MAG TPA: hypothetical protein PLO37_02060 [Candidatus Hydrogenedentes bacterium]|nr:hypothetical protein [Candidatus Hydrogenedentota bacterium]HPG65602.1 hypothetical protein [Candidatus Hydrogenedentota bacterium]